jgi:hypothetical protein
MTDKQTAQEHIEDLRQELVARRMLDAPQHELDWLAHQIAIYQERYGLS